MDRLRFKSACLGRLDSIARLLDRLRWLHTGFLAEAAPVFSSRKEERGDQPPYGGRSMNSLVGFCKRSSILLTTETAAFGHLGVRPAMGSPDSEDRSGPAGCRGFGRTSQQSGWPDRPGQRPPSPRLRMAR